MAFQGSLAELHLPDIIQLISVSGKSGVFQLIDGAHRSSMDELAKATVAADKVLVF